jgi:hypothetical protein
MALLPTVVKAGEGKVKAPVSPNLLILVEGEGVKGETSNLLNRKHVVLFFPINIKALCIFAFTPSLAIGFNHLARILPSASVHPSFTREAGALPCHEGGIGNRGW